MGLAASQCRILYLTARQNDVTYDMMCNTQEKQIITRKTEEAAVEYSNSLANSSIQLNIGFGTEVDNFQNISYSNLTAAGYTLVSRDNKKVYLKSTSTTSETGEETTTWDIPTDENGNKISQVYKVQGKNITNEDGTITENTEDLNLDNGEYIKIGDNYYKLESANAYIANSKLIDGKLSSGLMTLAKLTAKEFNVVDWGADVAFATRNDSSDDSAAAAKYTAELGRLTALEKQLDNELKLLETEQTAITKELDSIKDVISKNIDHTYGIFSDGN